MDSAIQNTTLTIKSVEETPTQIKLKDENGKTWSFFKTKQNGEPTAAYQQWGQYHIGDTTGVGYKMAGKEGNIRSIINFRPPEFQKSAPLPRVTEAQPPQQPRNFDREAYEKCCSIWCAAKIQAGTMKGANFVDFDEMWALFQAIRKDGEKRFATGWDKAEKIFKGPTMTGEPVYDDAEIGNKALEEAQAQGNINVDGIPF